MHRWPRCVPLVVEMDACCTLSSTSLKNVPEKKSEKSLFLFVSCKSCNCTDLVSLFVGTKSSNSSLRVQQTATGALDSLDL